MLKNFLNSKRSYGSLIHIIYLRKKKRKYIYKTKNEINKKASVNSKAFSLSNKENFYSLLISQPESLKKNKEEILQQSEGVLRNNILSISGDPIFVGNFINWNKDYLNNFIWENSHYSVLKTKDFTNSSDVKNVWEFSRFYFITTLAKALYITNETKYFSKIDELIAEWERQNPINQSINWTVSMEVAIRSVNLIEIYSLIKASNLVSLESEKYRLQKKIIEQLLNHKLYIENNLEKGLNSNNHYLSNIIGLIYIYIFMEAEVEMQHRFNLTYGKKIKSLLKELNSELNYQVYSDGFSYEDSISYHALNLEMIVSILNLLKLNAETDYFFKEIKEIEIIAFKMYKALQKVLVEGSIPVIGDIDNGRLLIFDESSNKHKSSFKYLIDICSTYFGEKYKDTNCVQESVGFLDAGIYKYKFTNYTLFFKCGKIGQNGLGGHAHNDQLSIMLYVKSQPIFIDSGTGNYTSDRTIRNLLRSTKSHNTLEIENLEQNDISFDIFKMNERTFSKILKYDEWSIAGKHEGYVQEVGSRHIREIVFANDSILINDRLDKSVNNKVILNFILDDKVVINKINETTCILTRNGIKTSLETQKGKIDFEEVIFSENYGEIKNTIKLVINFEKGFSENTIRLGIPNS